MRKKADSKQEAVTLIDQAEKLMAAGSYQEAFRKCRKAITLNPKMEIAHNLLGTAQIQLGLLDEAVESFERAVQMATEYWGARDNLRNARLLKERETYIQIHEGNKKFVRGFDIERQVYGESDLPGYYYFDLSAYLIRGYPGHRNLPGKSGYNPMDLYVEQGYMAGLLLKLLFTLKLPMDNFVYQTACALFGIILCLPAVMYLYGMISGQSGVDLMGVIAMSPMSAIGMFLLLNVIRARIKT
jgi:tetratricopeptide (TPR) repeat protein